MSGKNLLALSQHSEAVWAALQHLALVLGFMVAGSAGSLATDT